VLPFSPNCEVIEVTEAIEAAKMIGMIEAIEATEMIGMTKMAEAVRVKICGVKCPADVEAVNETKPDYVGFVFAPSKRQVDARKAATLRETLDERIVSVGVFVDAPIKQIVQLHKSGVIDMAQLHGNEDEPYLIELKKQCDLPLIKALRLGLDDPALCLNDFAKSPAVAHANYLLFDSHQPGSGECFDWTVLESNAAFLNKPFFLAGGIRPTTVSAALALRPFCLDMSTGVETDGIKDARKIADVLRQAQRKGQL
jgi:phosphoribosylanthranilate isomerase